MIVKMLDGGEFDLKPEMLDSFKMKLRGPVHVPGETAYDQSRMIWNAMIDRKPGLVVRCLGITDVIVCVRFAREHNLLLCIKGGGHNIAGLAVADGALMLDMSLMRGVWVDAKEKIVHAQAGCLLGDVDRETQLYGLSTVLGFISLTGIAGLTLGGGFGYLTRRWGWTVDSVVGMDVITAEGKLVRASKDQNPDLFWGLRGGGGNFGVVTGIDYALYPIGPQVMGGFVAWPMDDASGVFERYRTLVEKTPSELTLVLNMRPAPRAFWIPREWHGRPVAMIGACFTGNPESVEKVISPIKSFGKPIGDCLIPQPYHQLQTMLDATQPDGRRNYWKSENLPGIETGLGPKAIEHASMIPSPHSSVIFMQVDGALNEYDEDYNPMGNRDARQVLLLAGSWENAGADAENIGWVRKAWKDIKQFSTGGTYLNFLSEDEGTDRLQAALGKRLNRLAEVKKKWDPENIFRTNRNIAPA